jgi:hypothetical protein
VARGHRGRAPLYAEKLAGATAYAAREAIVDGAARERRPRRRADPHPAQGELLRARREAAGDRHLAPVVHPQRRPRRRPQRRAHRARREIAFHPGFMRSRYANWVQPASTATGWSRASASSACRSRSGTPSTPTASRLRPPIVPARTSCRSTRPPTRRRATPRTSAAYPAASSATPTSGHLGDLLAQSPQIAGRLAHRRRHHRPALRGGLPDGPAPAGARHHPHLAVRHRRASAPRARHRCRGPTPRSPAGSSTPTARR